MNISNFKKFAATMQDYRKLERDNENLIREHQRRSNRFIADKNAMDYFTYNQNIKPEDAWYSQAFKKLIVNPAARGGMYLKTTLGNPIYDAWKGKDSWAGVLKSGFRNAPLGVAHMVASNGYIRDADIIQQNIKKHPELVYGSTSIVSQGNPNEGYTYNPESNTVDKKSESELAKLVPESITQVGKDLDSAKWDAYLTAASGIPIGRAATILPKGVAYVGKELIKKPVVSAITHPKSTLAGTALLAAPTIDTRNTYDNTLLRKLSLANKGFNWDKLTENATPEQLNRAQDFIHKNLVTPNPRYDPNNPGTQKKFNLKPLQASQLHEMSKDLMSIFDNK